MNETIQMILTRRSIRKFNDKPIDKETMELLMDCAIHAPSGMGKDTWHFVGITNKILTRRSIRKFNDKPIDKETMELLMDCAIHAPSGMGKDTWHFVGITNKVLIDELIDIVGKMLNNEDYNMYHPSALIIPFNLMDNSHGVEDNACALENIFIAANSLGIGSVKIMLVHWKTSLLQQIVWVLVVCGLINCANLMKILTCDNSLRR